MLTQLSIRGRILPAVALFAVHVLRVAQKKGD
jgi:hypothetical protein